MDAKNVIYFSIFTFVISACSSNFDGSEYIGKWKDKSGHVAEFVRDGNAIFLAHCGTKVPATFSKDNNALQVGPMSLSYSKNSDSLFATDGMELKRVNGTVPEADQKCGSGLAPMPTGSIKKPYTPIK